MEPTTRAIGKLLMCADKHNAPAPLVAQLWRLRGEPHAVQVERLGQFYGALLEAHQETVAAGE